MADICAPAGNQRTVQLLDGIEEVVVRIGPDRISGGEELGRVGRAEGEEIYHQERTAAFALAKPTQRRMVRSFFSSSAVDGFSMRNPQTGPGDQRRQRR